MVCPVAEAAQTVVQLLNGIAVIEESTCNRSCVHNTPTNYLVFDALLAIAAAQESLDCPSMWQRQGASLDSCGVKLKVVAAKRTTLLHSLIAAFEYANYFSSQIIDTLRTLLLHFATKPESKDSLSTVLKLLCRMGWYARGHFVRCLSSQDLDKLLLRSHDCYNDLTIFFTTFDILILTKDQLILLYKATLERQPDVHSLRAAQNVFLRKNLDDKHLRDIATWAARAPQDVAIEAVDLLYDFAKIPICPPTQELCRLATLFPQSPKIFKIYCSSAMNGDYGGLEYLESAAQHDNSFINDHCDVMYWIYKDALDIALRLCNRPGYESLFGRILILAFSKNSNDNIEKDSNIERILEPHRPQLEIWRQEFLDRVVGRCDYSPEDLDILAQIKIDSILVIGNCKVCRADLLQSIKRNQRFVNVNCIHTSCEMAVVMQPSLKLCLRPCDKNHQFLLNDFDTPAINILQRSKNQTEMFAVLDAHSDPFDGLRYTGSFLHDATIHVFKTYIANISTYFFKRICDALGQVEVTALQDPKIPKWKEIAAACTLVLKYGYDQGHDIMIEHKPLASLVIDYAKSLGGSPSDIKQWYNPLGAIAPMALCTTNKFSCSLDDAICIARDPRAPELAKYHTDEFSTIALVIARAAAFLVRMNYSKFKWKFHNFSFVEIAWIFAYLPRVAATPHRHSEF